MFEKFAVGHEKSTIRPHLKDTDFGMRDNASLPPVLLLQLQFRTFQIGHQKPEA